MDKRYQVFVSSTFTDLQEERSAVFQTLMELDCIPAGMELFPAMDEEQFEFIKRVIQDSDYYLLIVGGRYGSMTEDGISFTEKEYDYAVSIGLKVIALLHGKPDQLPVAKSDIEPSVRAKLEAFRSKVQTGRLVKYWENPTDLASLLATSLPKIIKTYPAIGWIRGNATNASNELLVELNELRKLKDQLEAKVEQLSKQKNYDGMKLADLDENHEFRVEFNNKDKGDKEYVKCSLKWEQITYFLGMYFEGVFVSENARSALAEIALNRLYQGDMPSIVTKPRVEFFDFKVITAQLKALGHFTVTPVSGEQGVWQIAPEGERLLNSKLLVQSTRGVEANGSPSIATDLN